MASDNSAIRGHASNGGVPRVWLEMLYLLAVIAVGSLLLVASRYLSFMNQGDWARSAGWFLGMPTDGLPGWNNNPFGATWSFRPGPFERLATDNSSSLLFQVQVYLQSLTRKTFSVSVMGFMAKLFLLFVAEQLARRFSKETGDTLPGRFVFFVLLALAIFGAHNIALMNTFYQEYALFLFLPVALLAVTLPRGFASSAIMCGAALMCGGAKLQFFYIPTLLFAVLLLLRVTHGQRLEGRLLTTLLLIQLLCLQPITHTTEYIALNRYHATYFGSYLVMTEAELDRAGVPPEERRCIGVDAWGNRLNDIGLTGITGGHVSCVDKGLLPLERVLLPWALDPMLLARLLSTISPRHFASDYFHVSHEHPYLRSIRADGSFGAGALLVGLSSWRDRWFLNGGFVATALLGIVLPCVFRRKVPVGVAGGSLLLGMFAASQLVVVVLGEGVRDLGRHLSAAQYAMDLLAVYCAIQVTLVTAGYWRRLDRP